MRLELEPDVEVVGEAADGESALALAAILCPDVIIMDIEMPGMDGISATRALRENGKRARVVMLSLYDDIATQARAREAGAVAFVAKHRMEEPLLAAIRAAAGEAAA
jgi:DNA-binding NarL/FixJ family response regulator